jgi:hypothetical protein
LHYYYDKPSHFSTVRIVYRRQQALLLIVAKYRQALLPGRILIASKGAFDYLDKIA